jgi:hypothetical protein
MGRSLEIPLRVDMDEFPAGTTHDTSIVTVDSNGGSARLDVALTIALEPEIEALSDTLELAPTDPEGSALQGYLSIRNVGLATAYVNIRAQHAPQLDISRDQVEIKAGKKVRVRVNWEGPPTQEAERPFIELQSPAQELRLPITFGA